MPSKYSIKDLERLSGIKAHTLRIWEQRYNILKPQRTDTNIRYYCDSDLKRILNISLLNSKGYKISKIAGMTDPQILVETEKFLSNYTDESAQIENLVLCLMDLNQERFETTINNSITHYGFENTFEKIVFPFLRQLGNMWITGMISPAQEHYISNLIRQKLIVGIDGVKPNKISDPKTYILFLPNHELHEMGLLYCHYLTKAKGHRCIYLGQSLPADDLSIITESAKPDKIVTVITSKIPEIEINDYLHYLRKLIPNIDFLVSGKMIIDGSEQYELPKGFKIFNDFKTYKSILAK